MSLLKAGSLPVSLLTGLAIGGVIILTRMFGWWQLPELFAYDALVRLQPTEKPDDRLLVVGITDEDLRRNGYPYPDAVLLKLLDKLTINGASLTGLDIYRESPGKALAARMHSDSRLVGIVRLNRELTGLEAPPLPGMQRYGFSDIPKNDPDEVVRRAYLYINLKPPLGESFPVFHLPYALALEYLERLNRPSLRFAGTDLQIGGVPFNRLEANSGSYQSRQDLAATYQTLIRYNLPQPARFVTASDVLDGKVDASTIKGRIVLVGYTAESVNDIYTVPYRSGRVPGVILNAHVLHQVLGATLDGRSLPWYLSDPLEWLWIGLWGAVGALVADLAKTPRRGLLSIVGCVVLISSCCLALFWQQGWIPLVPSVAATMVAGLAVLIRPRFASPLSAREEFRRGDFGRNQNAQETTEIDPALGQGVEQDWWKGVVVAERYEIREPVGRGGMGDVFLSLDRSLGREVALKVLRCSALNLESLSTRFEREARLCAALRSPYIVQVSDYGLTRNGFPFYTMEYLRGRTLRQLLDEQPRLSLDQSVSIIRQICLGLMPAHAGVDVMLGERQETIKVVHRDLKPDNIFLVPENSGEQVKILDFGIAKLLRETECADGETELTKGSFLGTSRYASPEQWRNISQIDQRSDIYSLGILFYEMLSGTNPFGIQTKEQRNIALWYDSHTRVEPIPLREQAGCQNIPEAIEKCILLCLAKTPEQRPASVELILKVLSDFFPPAGRQHNAG